MSDDSSVPVRSRDRRQSALRSVQLALRSAHQGLRQAHDALRPVVRHGRSSGLWIGAPDAGSVALGWRDREPVLGVEMNPAAPRGALDEVDVAHQVAIDSLPRRLEIHYVQVLRLREENRQLCAQVARLLGERPRSRPCS